MRDITGPADVKVGDVVSLSTALSYGTVGTVTKVGSDSLTIRTDEGKSRTAKYNRIDASGFRRRVVYQFKLLSEHDLWARREPKSEYAEYASRQHRLISVRADLWLDEERRPAVIAAVNAYASWLAAEPKEQP
jgi:hypothetical protein